MQGGIGRLDLPEGMGEAECPDCGARLGGWEGCSATFHALTHRARTSVRLAARQRAVHDAYCLQHPSTYTRSVKSFMAHLRGCCLAIEHASDPSLEAMIWADLTLPPDAAKVPPSSPMTLTIKDLAAAETIEAYEDVAERYVNDVWKAWQPHHHLARRWLQFALTPPRIRSRQRHPP